MKIVTIVGARPQFIKASVVSLAIRENGIEEIIIHTGQHYDHKMSNLFFEEMKIPRPNYQLDINGISHGAMTGRMMEQIELILIKEKPDCVIVFGDTNSTLAGALAAKKLHIKVIHIEAGLRSFNMAMPEEINRIITDRISDVLFCPTVMAQHNLDAEGFTKFDCIIDMVGDVMYDCFLHYQQYQKNPEIKLNSKPLVLATIHRAENTEDKNNLLNIVHFLNDLAEKYNVCIPLHPRTVKIIKDHQLELNANVIEPVGYLEMLYLLNNCTFVVTDSGGLQKEAYFAHKKCITLRTETEWVELVDSGWNQLVNPQNKINLNDIDLKLPEKYEFYYGNGDTCKKITSRIKSVCVA
jgi:UDP-GlcNAc3NAcA epimerase